MTEGSSYDKRSFLSGIAVGRQLKGWATGGSAGGGGGGTGSLSITANGIYDVEQYAQAVVDVPAEAPSVSNIFLVQDMILVVDVSTFSHAININAKLVPESVFDVTDIVE